MSGEAAPPDTSIEWTGASGKSFDVNDPPGGTTYIGRCVGKQLFISDVDDKKKKVEALVKVSAPGPEDSQRKSSVSFLVEQSRSSANPARSDKVPKI